MERPADTIVALATPPGRGGIGVIRVSGPGSAAMARALTGREPQDRRALFATFRDGDGTAIDSGIALFFAGPRSFTGEDVLEIQAHGSPVVLDLLVHRVLALGARQAGPGEFSQRAFLNGKLDLAQAEAIADLVNSATVEAARSAERTLEGVLSRQVGALRDAVVRVRTHQEALIDFADDLDPEDVDAPVREGIANLLAEVDRVLNDAGQGRILTEGIRLVIAGPPNAGKSSLINALAGTDAAIVSEVAGTTRDVIRESIAIDGIPVHVADTAGLQDTPDPVERLGIERTHTEIRGAEILLYVVDCRHGLGAADRDFLATVPAGLSTIVVQNKLDLCPAGGAGEDGVRLSALTGAGLDRLRAAIKGVFGIRGTGGLYFANRRHLDALGRCRGHLEAARDLGENGAGPELVAEELRLAHEALGEITGAFTSDDLLGAIFATFCIGK